MFIHYFNKPYASDWVGTMTEVCNVQRGLSETRLHEIKNIIDLIPNGC